MDSLTALNPATADYCVVFERPDTTGATQCDQCGGWIVGGTIYYSDGKTYCPNCTFDDSGKFVDSVSVRVRYWGPAADMAREIEQEASKDEAVKASMLEQIDSMAGRILYLEDKLATAEKLIEASKEDK